MESWDRSKNSWEKSIRKVIVPIGPSIAYVELTQDQFALIDADDAERVGSFNWFAWRETENRNYYAVRMVKHRYGAGQERIPLHRFILNTDFDEVDHRNLVTLDCRKINLREATHMENMWNRKIPTNNTSGYKGVRFIGGSKPYNARITYNKRSYDLGSYVKAISAHRAYCRAAKKYFGEFSRFE